MGSSCAGREQLNPSPKIFNNWPTHANPALWPPAGREADWRGPCWHNAFNTGIQACELKSLSVTFPRESAMNWPGALRRKASPCRNSCARSRSGLRLVPRSKPGCSKSAKENARPAPESARHGFSNTATLSAVVDSSVLIDSGQHDSWAEGILSRGTRYAPELVMVETMNILNRLERAKQITRAEANVGL
jgi:hypothetical protein